MQLLFRYLAIPDDYVQTEGLRWSSNGDAIETADAKTFAIAKMLPPFLEGFSAQRPLIHFVYILELLRLLKPGDDSLPGVPLRQCRTVREAYLPRGTLRNAGAFFGIVCSDVSSACLTREEGLDLAKSLATSPTYPKPGSLVNPEAPPLDIASFRRLVSERLEDFTELDLRKWFRFGTGPAPDEGKRLAEEIVSTKPPAVRATIEDLLRQRPRLAGALPLVDTMISALALPPRRHNPPELPLGGYADVTNRGEPERLLPSQFALDSDDFIRRFAEKELLFFRREEPHQRTREQLVLLVDQGVRTWGHVRLALSAAVLAFRKFAERRKLPFVLRFSADADRRLDPSACEPAQFVDLLEASELSANPAELVCAEVGETEPKDADIVVLTHPRSLDDEHVKRAMAGIPETKRLFALAVDDEGSAVFSQLRHGESLPISRFRVDVASPQSTFTPISKDKNDWTGDIEPVPFPFPTGPFREIVSIAFDADSRYLLVLTQQGMLHLWDLEKSTLETLPRAYSGQVFSRANAVVGVRNGFVVGGWLGADNIAATHYDLNARVVKLHQLVGIRADFDAIQWYSFPDIHSVAARNSQICVALDLASGTVYDSIPSRSATTSSNAFAAFARTGRCALPPPVIPVKAGPNTKILPSDRSLLVHFVTTGDLRVIQDTKSYEVRSPLSDGKKLLEGADITHAQFADTTLAVCLKRKTLTTITEWQLLSIHNESARTEFPGSPMHDSVSRLSSDGRFFARQCGAYRIIVDAFPKAGGPVLVTSGASLHNSIPIELGYREMNIVIGRRHHALSWWSGPLTHRFERHRGKTKFSHVTEIAGSSHPLVSYDPTRFIAVASKEFDVVIDVAGQIIVYDRHRSRLVCIFLVRRGQFAAWMPDGTRYGPSNIIGQPSTPDALERIGEALRRASSTVES